MALRRFKLAVEHNSRYKDHIVNEFEDTKAFVNMKVFAEAERFVKVKMFEEVKVCIQALRRKGSYVAMKPFYDILGIVHRYS